MPPRSPTATDEESRTTELLDELANAGLISAEVGDDGTASYLLTPTGEKAARQMAMHDDAYALILLGALAASGAGLN